MRTRQRIVPYGLASLIFLCGPLHGEESTPSGTPPSDTSQVRPVRLKNYEPTLLGYTKDSDDEPFMDFTISLQHPIFAESLNEGRNRLRVLPYFAFTGRFGQYIGYRDSSPVVTKRFNPKLFLRYASKGFPERGDSPDSYVDFEYGHESNGQHVDSQSTFQTMTQDQGGNQEHAKDYISRGWDYLGITAKMPIFPNDSGKVYLYVSRKWYCGCWLQKHVEEKFDFEDPREISSIRQVSGWRAILRFDPKNENTFVDRAALIADTGTRNTFKYDTARIEIGIRPVTRIFGVPFMIWGQDGYLSDLAQYYKKVHSFGFAFVFETFGR